MNSKCRYMKAAVEKCKALCISISNYSQYLPEIGSLKAGEGLSQSAPRWWKSPKVCIEMNDLSVSKPSQESTENQWCLHESQEHMDGKIPMEEHSFIELGEISHGVDEARKSDDSPIKTTLSEESHDAPTTTSIDESDAPAVTTTLKEVGIPLNTTTTLSDDSCVPPVTTTLDESTVPKTEESCIPLSVSKLDESCMPSMTTTLDESTVLKTEESCIPLSVTKLDESCTPSMTTTLDESTVLKTEESCIPLSVSKLDESCTPSMKTTHDESYIPSMKTTLDESGISLPTTTTSADSGPLSLNDTFDESQVPTNTHTDDVHMPLGTTQRTNYRRTKTYHPLASDESKAETFPERETSRGSPGMAGWATESYRDPPWFPRSQTSSLEPSNNQDAFSQSPPGFFGNTALAAEGSSKTRGPTKTPGDMRGVAAPYQGPAFPYPPTWPPAAIDPPLPWPPLFPMHQPPWALPANIRGK